MSKGRVTQFGPTLSVFRDPDDLLTARTFSDPPLNTIVLPKKGSKFTLDGGADLPVPAELAGIADATYTIGFQPHHLSLQPPVAGVRPLGARVLVTEITGSESFVHLDFGGSRWVMLSHGIIALEPDEKVDVYIDPRHLLVFDAEGAAVRATKRKAA